MDNRNNKYGGGLLIAGGVLLILILSIIYFRWNKRQDQKGVENSTVMPNSQATGYWSNALEAYAFEIDQQGTKLYASLYQIENKNLILITNRGAGRISRNSVDLRFSVRRNNDSIFYRFKGFLSTDGKRLRATFTITSAVDTQSREMDLVKTIY